MKRRMTHGEMPRGRADEVLQRRFGPDGNPGERLAEAESRSNITR